MFLHLYEDALETCDKALTLDDGEEEVKYIKARCLAHLHRFEEGIDIFKSI